MRNRTSLLAVVPVIIALAGCGSITVPASGVDSKGVSYSGSTTASMSGGTFSVTGTDGVVCSGTYDPFNRSKRIEAKTTCTNGRKGTIYVVRNSDGMGGKGDAEFDDGTTGKFVFGKKK